MVDRIRTLLQLRQLSTTQFADAIGVARPVISHILSGRNKPSLEVVQRILGAFPDLSMAWLLNGTEPMLITAATTDTEVPPAPRPAAVATTPPPRPAAFSRRSAPATAPEVAQVATPLEPIAAPPVASPPSVAPGTAAVAMPQPLIEPLAVNPIAGIPELPGTPIAAQQAAVLAVPTAMASPVASAPSAVATPQPAPGADPTAATALLDQSGKAIRRIVIFYRDGSFADYQPE